MTKRDLGADVAKPDIDLTEHTLDLRAEEAAPAPTPIHRVEDAPSPLERELFALLGEPVLHDGALLEVLIELCAEGVAPAPPADPRAATWCRLVDTLVRAGERSTYVGMFRVRLDEAVGVASSLSPADRELAALLVLDRTAATASTARDFRHGVLAARTLDPHSVGPRTVVENVLRACLRYDDSPSGASTVPFGLSVALAVLASGSGQCVTADDTWALRAAIAGIPRSLEGPIRDQVATLTRHDRRILEQLLAKRDGSRRFWQRKGRGRRAAPGYPRR